MRLSEKPHCCGLATSPVVHATGPTLAGHRLRAGAYSSPCRKRMTEPTVPRRPLAHPCAGQGSEREPSPLCQPPRDRGIQRRRTRTPSIDELPRGDRTIRWFGHHLLRHTVPVTPSSRSSLGRDDSLTACTPPTEHRSSTSATHTTRGHTREPRPPPALQPGNDSHPSLAVTAPKELDLCRLTLDHGPGTPVATRQSPWKTTHPSRSPTEPPRPPRRSTTTKRCPW